MKTLHLSLALVFALFAALQYNDPDPVQWMLVYGSVSALCVGAAFGRFSKPAVIVVSVTVLVWMLTLLPGFLAWIDMGMPSITGTMQAHEPYIEVVREFLGLAIALIVLLHLVRLTFRRV